MIKLFDDWVIIPGQCDYALAKYVSKVNRRGKTEDKYKYIGFYRAVEGCLKRLGEELTKEALKDRSTTLRETVTTIRERNAKVEKLLTEVIAYDDLK